MTFCLILSLSILFYDFLHFDFQRCLMSSYGILWLSPLFFTSDTALWLPAIFDDFLNFLYYFMTFDTISWLSILFHYFMTSYTFLWLSELFYCILYYFMTSDNALRYPILFYNFLRYFMIVLFYNFLHCFMISCTVLWYPALFL